VDDYKTSLTSPQRSAHASQIRGRFRNGPEGWRAGGCSSQLGSHGHRGQRVARRWRRRAPRIRTSGKRGQADDAGGSKPHDWKNAELWQQDLSVNRKVGVGDWLGD